MNVLSKKDYPRLESFMCSIGVENHACKVMVYRAIHKLEPDHTPNRKDKDKVIPNLKCQNGLISHGCDFHVPMDDNSVCQVAEITIQANGIHGNNYQLVEINLTQEYPKQ